MVSCRAPGVGAMAFSLWAPVRAVCHFYPRSLRGFKVKPATFYLAPSCVSVSPCIC